MWVAPSSLATARRRRHGVEDRLAADIARRGVAAVPSYQLITAADTRDDATLKAAMQEGGFDGAVVWRTVGVRTDGDQLIWTGTSETLDPASLDKLMDGVVDATLASMRHDGLVSAR